VTVISDDVTLNIATLYTRWIKAGIDFFNLNKTQLASTIFTHAKLFSFFFLFEITRWKDERKKTLKFNMYDEWGYPSSNRNEIDNKIYKNETNIFIMISITLHSFSLYFFSFLNVLRSRRYLDTSLSGSRFPERVLIISNTCFCCLCLIKRLFDMFLL
jgi:hypothetical protein